MISWREVTKAPFEYTESFSQSASGRTTYSASLDTVTGDRLIIGTFTARYSTKTIQGSTSNETSSSSFSASYRTINEDGISTSVESGSTYFLSISESGSFTEAAQFDDTAQTTIGPSSNFTNTTTATAGSNPNATSESNENTSEGTTSTSVAMASSTPNTANPETSTTTTEQYYPTISTETTSSYSFVSTSSVSTTTISETDTITSSTWTTATSSSSANSIYTTETISTSTAEAAATVDEEQTGNAFNTIYQAGPKEVLYVAGQIPLSAWNAIGQTAPTATRTTVSAQYTTRNIYARGSEAENSSATNSSTTSSISWSQLDFSQTTITSAFLLFLPHVTFTQEIFDPTTTSSSNSFSSAEQIVEYNGTTTSVEFSYARSTTVQKYFGSFAYQGTITSAAISTKISGLGADTVTYSNTSETLQAGGNTTFPPNTIALGVQLPPPPPTWQVFALPGAAFSNSLVGLYYTFTGQGLSEVKQAKAGRAISTILPATNDTYTANRTGLTWRPSSNETSQTSSGLIAASGQTALELISSRSYVFGGNLAPGEVANEIATRGLYRDAAGNTVWKSGNDASYGGSRSTSYLAPKYWLGAGGLAIRTAPRNDTALPSVVSQAF
jgi:hypothetical protein